MAIRIDKTGNRYGRLIIIGLSHIVNGVVHWRVRCDCGNNKIVLDGNIVAGKTKSCGCFEGNVKKHGMSDTRIYTTWTQMKSRCSNKNTLGFKYYGGRGVKVCKRWLKFENFLEDMGERPKEMSIERIDNKGNYEPSNCKWATIIEQANNTRHNVSLEYKSECLNMTQWARKLGISRACIWNRVKRNLPQDVIFSNKKFKAWEAKALKTKDIEYGLCK